MIFYLFYVKKYSREVSVYNLPGGFELAGKELFDLLPEELFALFLDFFWCSFAIYAILKGLHSSYANVTNRHHARHHFLACIMLAFIALWPEGVAR